MMSISGLHIQVVRDFHEARRKADLQEVFSRLTGKSTELLSYEDVRKKLRALESSGSTLREIPLAAIVGSVGRYTDFTRDFLPRTDSDKSRWAGVMMETIGPTGLPPIDVYQIGEVYFVLDGNHRVSVARALGATHIQAYITEVRTHVPLTADILPDGLIVKAEYAKFLEETQIDKLRPESDLSLTLPGQYPILQEHISVHRYFMGIDEGREVPYEEAVGHWYDTVYLPIAEIIQERGILHHFPGRTAADLYLWLSKHKGHLEQQLNWQVTPATAVHDMVTRFSSETSQVISRMTARILDVMIPDGLESGPPTGTWRMEQLEQSNRLFNNILVGISKDDTEWHALQQAIFIAQREGAHLQGLHVVPKTSQMSSKKVIRLQEEFERRCQEAGVQGSFAVEVGSAARQICDRAHWTDLIIGPLTHPPADTPLVRLSSGFRIMVRRCSRPILAVPNAASGLKHALLAYNDSPKAEEALYIATYMSCKWEIPVTVVIVESHDFDTNEVKARAQAYLEERCARAEMIIKEGSVTQTILETAQERGCDLILIGGYKASPMVEVVKGSLVDELLRETHIPTLICR
jgi:nucleotide-binding universal stress UspA family protein